MVISKKQKRDLECIKFFIPRVFNNCKITIEDEIMFLENSDRGLHKEKIDYKRKSIDGFHALIEGKKWRKIMINQYEQGILDGSVPYVVLLEYMPRFVVDYLKKEMFKGYDKDTIQNSYNELMEERSLEVNDQLV